MSKARSAPTDPLARSSNERIAPTCMMALDGPNVKVGHGIEMPEDARSVLRPDYSCNPNASTLAIGVRTGWPSELEVAPREVGRLTEELRKLLQIVGQRLEHRDLIGAQLAAGLRAGEARDTCPQLQPTLLVRSQTIHHRAFEPPYRYR